MTAHHRISPHGKKGYETIHGYKYVITYKYLPCKNAGITNEIAAHFG
jgi:hypothetical protein